MKKYGIFIVSVFLVFMVAWTAFGQREGERPSSAKVREPADFPMFQLLSPEEAAELREKWPSMSQEEREKFRTQMREKWASLSIEEREKFRTQMRERFASKHGRLMSREDQLQSIKAIEEQLAKLKASIESIQPEETTSFKDLSQEQRSKLREKITKTQQDRTNALQLIIKQLARLQDRRQPLADIGEYLIINTSELKPIQDSAVKEKAQKTAQLLERLIAGATGKREFGDRPLRLAPESQGIRRPPRPRREVSEHQSDTESSGG